MSFTSRRLTAGEYSNGSWKSWEAEEQHTTGVWVTHAMSAQAGAPPVIYQNGVPLTVTNAVLWQGVSATNNRMIVGNADSPALPLPSSAT